MEKTKTKNETTKQRKHETKNEGMTTIKKKTNTKIHEIINEEMKK